MCVIHTVDQTHQNEPSTKIIQFLKVKDYVLGYKWISNQDYFGSSGRAKNKQKWHKESCVGSVNSLEVFARVILVKNGSWGIGNGPIIDI